MRRIARAAAERVQLAGDIALVVHSGLFDADWYASEAGCSTDPARAARHFLTVGCAQGFTPHPLFDQTHFTKRAPKSLGKQNPLVGYLTDSRYRKITTHPLIGFRQYMHQYPESRDYPRGVTRHYLEVGAAKKFRPNGWYQPSPAEPEGLADWLRARRREWVARRELAGSPWTAEAPAEPGLLPAVEPSAAATVSVVMAVGRVLDDRLGDAIGAVLAQSLPTFELLISHRISDMEQVRAQLRGALGPTTERRVHLIAAPDDSGTRGLSMAADEATGTWVAFADPNVVWRDHHLQATVGAALAEGALGAFDIVERAEAGKMQYRRGVASRERSLVTQQIELATLVVRRDVLAELGGLDPKYHDAAAYDLELKLEGRGPLLALSRVGARLTDVPDGANSGSRRRRPWLDLDDLDSWPNVVLNQHLVDWSTAAGGDSGTVSIIIPTHAESRMTITAVERVMEAAEQARTERAGAASVAEDQNRVEVLVVNNDCPPDDAAALDTLPIRFADVRVLHQPVNRGYALGNNLAVPYARGATVVFLNNDTEVTVGWLEPLVHALARPQVHGAQSLLVYPSGSIQSAGVAFPASGGVPHVLLQGFPVEDAAGLEDETFTALTAAALAMRRSDVVRLQGFDPIFLNGMEDVDLGLRMMAERPGRFSVVPSSIVMHHESRAPGRFERSLVNRKIFLRRWAGRTPPDDVRLWRGRGYDLVGREIRVIVRGDRRASAAEPQLVRRRNVDVVESPPRLRWAIKNPAPWGPSAERWGDTHFARRLAVALRRLGQEVVIDYRGEFHRASSRFDDVSLTLRGVAPFSPMFGQVSLCWLISHPEMLARAEAESYDRLFAASRIWSERMSAEWGIQIDPLLQATDPELFNPDRGVPDTGHPLLFVGGSRKVLRPLVAAAVERSLPLSIYGDEWDELVPQHFLKAKHLPNTELGEAYRRAALVLNDHWEDMRLDGFISNRLFDASASGARVITDAVGGLDDLFGRSVQVVHDADELQELVERTDLDAVFGDDEERRAVAARLHVEHSFDARAATLLDAALELGAGRPDRSAPATNRPAPKDG